MTGINVIKTELLLKDLPSLLRKTILKMVLMFGTAVCTEKRPKILKKKKISVLFASKINVMYCLFQLDITS